MTKGLLDLRCRLPGSDSSIVAPSPQSDSVNQFFIELYKSAAEHLAVDAASNAELSAWAMQDLHKAAPAQIQDLCNEVPGVPKRFLPPGKPQDLYLQYLGWFDEVDYRRSSLHQLASVPGLSGLCLQARLGNKLTMKSDHLVPDTNSSRGSASYVTFWRVWRFKWSQWLQFSPSSEHTRCNTCYELELAIRNCRCNLPEKLRLAHVWRQHLRRQYADRSLYWSWRMCSRLRQNILTIIIDGMTKSRIAIPMMLGEKKPSFLDAVRRPHVACYAGIAHGYTANLYLLDQNVDTGANLFCEIVVDLIQQVANICRDCKSSFPEHLVVMSDNTVAQAKNACGFNLMSILVSKKRFLSTNLCFLEKGHTHEDVGFHQRSVNICNCNALLFFIFHVTNPARPIFLLGDCCVTTSPGVGNTRPSNCVSTRTTC